MVTARYYGCGVYGEFYEHCDGGEMVRDGLTLDGVYVFLGCFPGFFQDSRLVFSSTLSALR